MVDGELRVAAVGPVLAWLAGVEFEDHCCSGQFAKGFGFFTGSHPFREEKAADISSDARQPCRRRQAEA